MKTVHLFSIFFRNLFILLFIALISPINLSGQTKNNNISFVNITTNINTIKGKADQTYRYAERSYNADNLNEGKISAKQALLLLEEMKATITNAQTNFEPLLTSDNNKKHGKFLNSIASDLMDIQNKTSWAIHKANKIISTNEFDEVKPAAAEVMSETKKIETILAEATANITLADRELSEIK
ncbi:MAG: hypothetical protein HYU69_06950 [Bacteroidetes bacterium]|nr:hypothetical protein [Bacteroidota bacterium]